MQITSDMLTTMNDAYRANPVMKAAALAMGHQPLNEVVFNCENAAKGRFLFNHEVETMKVTNQKSSGRCWLFAALNLFREIAAKKMNVEFFELSQNFIAYYDKLEKANYFLDSIMQTLDLPKDDRMVTYIVSTGIQDGGQWDMMANLVKKYGLVPKAAMPETFQSENTRSLNAAINIKLRRAAAILRREYRGGASTEALNSICRETLADVHDMLTAGYGCPPESFDLEYKDKDDNFVRVAGLTPKTFFDQYIAFPFDEYTSVIHSPTDDKPFGRNYTVRFLGNVVGGKGVKYLNLPMDEFKQAVIAQLQDGKVVWVGSDVGKFGEREKGIWDDGCFDFETLTGLDLDLSKEDALNCWFAAMNHAMVLTGVNLDENGKPTRWKIENSWGDKNGAKGYYVCSDSWFDQYVFQAAVEEEFLGGMQSLLAQEPIELAPWDPMGTLAD